MANKKRYKNVYQQSVPNQNHSADMPNIQELFTILVSANQAQSMQMITILMDQIKRTDQQLAETMQELKVLKNQMNSGNVQNGMDVKNTESLAEVAKKSEEQVIAFKEQLHNMKQSLNEKAGRFVQGVKKHGILTMQNVCSYLGVKESFEKLKDNYQNNIDSAEKSIQKINSIEKEIHATSQHFLNIGKAFAGKKIEEVTEERNGGKIFNAFRKPYENIKAKSTKSLEKVGGMIQKMEQLEKAAMEIKESKFVKSSQNQEKFDSEEIEKPHEKKEDYIKKTAIESMEKETGTVKKTAIENHEQSFSSAEKTTKDVPLDKFKTSEMEIKESIPHKRKENQEKQEKKGSEKTLKSHEEKEQRETISTDPKWGYLNQIVPELDSEQNETISNDPKWDYFNQIVPDLDSNIPISVKEKAAEKPKINEQLKNIKKQQQAQKKTDQNFSKEQQKKVAIL